MSRGAIIIEGHIQGLSNTRSLGRRGIPVIVLNHDRNCVARHSKYCTRFFHCPPYSSDKLADFLLKIAEDLHLEGWLVFPSNDLAVMTLSRNKERLAKHFYILAPDPPVTSQICDKYLLMKTAGSAGLAIPGTWHADEPIPGGIRYPLLLKGRIGLPFYRVTASKAFLCHSPEEYNGLLHRILLAGLDKTEIMVQELIPDEGEDGMTISAGVYCRKGDIKAVWTGVKIRQHPFRFGTATLAKAVKMDDVEDYVRQLMQALQYDGICEVELLRDPRDNKLKLIEINPRTWLWVELARASGIDLVWLAWQDACGEDPAFPESFTEGLIWRNFYTDLWFGIKSILRKEISMRKYLLGMKGPRVHAVWAPDDPAPFLNLTIMLPYLMRNR
jgi:D-aspartate ligase